MQRLGDGPLVGAVAETVDQADGRRDRALGLHARDQGFDLGRVDGAQDGPVGEYAFVDLEGQMAWDQRLGELDLRVVHLVAMLVADREDVGEALGDDERGGRPLALDQGIGDQGGGVHDHPFDAFGTYAGLGQDQVDAAEEAFREVVMGGERLVDGDRPVRPPQHRIGECAADIDSQRIGHDLVSTGTGADARRAAAPPRPKRLITGFLPRCSWRIG